MSILIPLSIVNVAFPWFSPTESLLFLSATTSPVTFTFPFFNNLFSKEFIGVYVIFEVYVGKIKLFVILYPLITVSYPGSTFCVTV